MIKIEDFDNLKCYFCEKYLSVAPIFLVSKKCGFYQCGRCRHISTKISIRNFTYERVVKYITFPCSNEGCKMQLLFGEVEMHEKCCSHRKIQCIATGCGVNVKCNDLRRHYQACLQAEPDRRIFQNCIQCLATLRSDLVLILEKFTHSYIFVSLFDSKRMYAGVFSLNSIVSKTKFTMKLSNKENPNPVVTFQHDVKEYNELEHCINCMRMNCRLSYHKFSLKNKKGENIGVLPVQINFDLYCEILSLPKEIKVCVEINDDSSYQ